MTRLAAVVRRDAWRLVGLLWRAALKDRSIKRFSSTIRAIPVACRG